MPRKPSSPSSTQLFDGFDQLGLDESRLAQNPLRTMEEPAWRPLPPTLRRVANTAGEIMTDPTPDKVDFLHAVLCQVGMPRKKCDSRVFERSSGAVSLLLEAGRTFQRGKWVEQPLPYGTRPRLVMVHIAGEALRTRSRQVEIGDSIYEFLQRLGIDTNGGPRGGYTMFRKQMEALAACQMMLGMSLPDRDVTINTQPISRFEAWLTKDNNGPRPLWPGMLELSQEFFDTLQEHAVPLDHRALAALKHSAMALDIYTWLAHRLHRVRKPDGTMVSWANLKDQFGQEYRVAKDFKKEFRDALRQVHAVYPEAKLDAVPGGLLLSPSPPPVPKIITSGRKPRRKTDAGEG